MSVHAQQKSREQGDEITLIMPSPPKPTRKAKTSLIVSSSSLSSEESEEEVVELPQIKTATKQKSSVEPGFGCK